MSNLLNKEIEKLHKAIKEAKERGDKEVIIVGNNTLIDAINYVKEEGYDIGFYPDNYCGSYKITL